MSANNGDWRSAAFRQKVILNIDDALKKSASSSGIQKDRNAQEIEQQIFDKAATRDSYMTIVARIILALSGTGGQNKGQPNTQNINVPMMDTNMQPSSMMNPEALRGDNAHILPKILVQQSPMSTPSPKIYVQSPSPATVQQGKQTKAQIRPTQVSSSTAYPSPSPIIPSPGPAGHSPAPEIAPSPSSNFAARASGIPSVESPGSFNPPSNPGSQESPVKLSDKEEQLYVEKLKQLSVYTEPLRKMIAKMQNDEDAANRDNKNLTKLKRLLSILGNSKERVSYQALLKVENVLVRRLGLSKPVAAPIGHSLLNALQARADSPQSNNTLYRMFAPTLATIHGPPICPPPVPSPRREREKSDSALPQVVESEIAQLASKFTVDFANGGEEEGGKLALVCSINDKNLPAVPSLLIRIPQDYPHASPQCDTKDYDSTEFLKWIKDRLKQKLSSFRRTYSFSTLLLNWESCVRYVSARNKDTSTTSIVA